jgi:sulfonate transport system substrate-binding protein
VRARLIQCGALAGTLRGHTPARGVVATSAPAASAATRVRIGYQKFGLLVLLKARGTFERPGHTIEWVEFPGGTQLAEALAQGRVDLGVVGEGPPILAQAAGAGIVYLAAEPPAPEAEAIVVHDDSDIRTVADLKGKTVAVNRGANVDYLLRCALHEAHLSYDDIKVAFVAPTGARAAFESREVDAWAIWNPLLASVAHGGARVLRDATGLAANTAYYVGRRDFADAHAELVAAFLAEVRATGAWANAHPEAVLDLLAPTLGIARPALAGALAHTRFGAAPLDAAAVAAQQRVADAFHAQRLIARPVRIADARWSPPRD